MSAAEKLAAKAEGKEVLPTEEELDADTGEETEIEDALGDEEDAETEEDEVDEEDDDEDKLPANIKDILNKNRRAMRAAEKKAEKLEKELADAKAAKSEEGDEEKAPADDKFRGLFLKSAVRSALAEAGAGPHAAKLVKLVDLDALEVSDDGTIEGLEDAVDELKEEFEDFFAAPEEKPAARKTRVDAGTKRPAPVKKKTSAELLAERASGK